MNGLDTTLSNGSVSSPEQQHHIRLACQACQRKKIKCDRTFPCGQCTRSSLQCIPSTRKPRARHVGKRAIDTELRSRITKLESLVECLSGEVGAQDDDQESDSEPKAENKDSSPVVGKYLGSPFWSSLTTEVQALRDALEDEPQDEEAEATSPTIANGPGHAAEYDLIICPPGAVYVMPGALAEPSPQLSATLCNAFCENVDRVFKIFHAPTLRAFMIEGKSYLGNDNAAPCNRVLTASVWFAAVNSLSENECHMLFGQSRSDQLLQFRRLVDVALAQADLMNTNDLATLQGLVTYMAASRLTDTSRRVWTLVGVVVRISRAMGLHHESVTRSPFITELRRRLWHEIRFLDVFSALDRGSELLISLGSYDTPLPKNTNDVEFDESSISIPDHETGLTDMSFARLAIDATYHTHRLTIPESKASGDTWQQRLEFAQKFADTVQERYLQYCDTSDPYQRMIRQVSTSMINSMILRAVRPMQKHISSVPPRVDSPYVLGLAVNSLKASEAVNDDPETAKWRWMVWVQWHALSIALAGLCLVRDTELANDAWVHVEKAYTRHSRHIADAKNGMLWKPIEKLHRKASAFRDHAETPSSVSISPPPSAQQNQQYLQQQQISMPYPNQPQVDPSLVPPGQPGLPGGMPTGGVLNSPMDMNFNNAIMSGIDLGNGEMSWMDFERILEDMSNPADVSLNDLQWQNNLSSGHFWPGITQDLG